MTKLKSHASLLPMSKKSSPKSSVPPAIELSGISKSFGPVQANKDIDLVIQPGSIHGIIGENGAGKSTLMSILYGFYQADSGWIKMKGELTVIPDSEAAIRMGIGMVHQHFMLVDNFTVLENIILGVEGGNILNNAMERGARGTFAVGRRVRAEG